MTKFAVSILHLARLQRTRACQPPMERQEEQEPQPEALQHVCFRSLVNGEDLRLMFSNIVDVCWLVVLQRDPRTNMDNKSEIMCK